jgi:hypothetical protein
VVVGGLLAIVLWQVTKSPAAVASAAAGTAVAATSTVATAPSASAVATASAAATVEISVAATPAEAKIFLDDKALAGNPAKAQVPKDGAVHQVRIEASGYASKVDSITFERDRSMDVALVKDAGSGDRQPYHGGPAVPTDDMTRPAGKRPQRTLDTSNPYQK